VIRNVPRNKGKRSEHTLVVIPHKLNFCPSWCGTATCSREPVFETAWEFRACAVSNVDSGKRRKEALVAPPSTGL
jgi:hypothetical protein